MKYSWGLMVLAVLASLTHFSRAGAKEVPDIVTIGGAITEIVFELGQGHRVVARDTTSTFPPEVQNLPDIGYMRRLSAEGVLVFEPSLILSEEGVGPQDVVDILEEVSIKFVKIPTLYDRSGIIQKIRMVGEALNVSERAEQLVAKTDHDLRKAEERAYQTAEDRKRVLFILSTQGGRILASGTGTAADGIIGMAGATNAISQFEGYKTLSDEAISAASPDVILMMDRSGDHALSDEELFGLPSLAVTPAGQTRSVVRMNGLYLLGFGPRTADAVSDLSRALYGE